MPGQTPNNQQPENPNNSQPNPRQAGDFSNQPSASPTNPPVQNPLTNGAKQTQPSNTPTKNLNKPKEEIQQSINVPHTPANTLLKQTNKKVQIEQIITSRRVTNQLTQTPSSQFRRGQEPAAQDLPDNRQTVPIDEASLPESLEKPTREEVPENQPPKDSAGEGEPESEQPETEGSEPTEDEKTIDKNKPSSAKIPKSKPEAEESPGGGAAKTAEKIAGVSPLGEIGKTLKFLTGGKNKILEIFGIFISGSSVVFIVIFISIAIFLGLLIAKLTFGMPTTGGNYKNPVSNTTGKTSGYSYWENKYAGISCPPPGKPYCHPPPHCASVRPDLVRVDFLGKKVLFHKCAAPDLEAVSKEIQAIGLNHSYDFFRDFGGTFCCRRNVNASSSCSPHSYGIAIDINPDKNPNVPRKGRAICPHDIPEEAIAIFKKHNFGWGGDFRKTCDAMHFEWRGKCP